MAMGEGSRDQSDVIVTETSFEQAFIFYFWLGAEGMETSCKLQNNDEAERKATEEDEQTCSCLTAIYLLHSAMQL